MERIAFGAIKLPAKVIPSAVTVVVLTEHGEDDCIPSARFRLFRQKPQNGSSAKFLDRDARGRVKSTGVNGRQPRPIVVLLSEGLPRSGPLRRQTISRYRSSQRTRAQAVQTGIVPPEKKSQPKVIREWLMSSKGPATWD